METVDARAWLADPQPIARLHLTGVTAALLKKLVAVPALSTVKVLDLSDSRLGDVGAIALAHSTRLGGLEELRLSQAHIADDGIAALAGSTALGSLRRLDLDGNKFVARGLKALATSRLPSLRHLGIANVNLRRNGSALATHGLVERLESLDLCGNHLQAQIVEGVVAVGLGELRHLDLSHNPLGMNGVLALASASLSQLQSLGLRATNPCSDGNGNRRDDALTALAGSTTLPSLRVVDLRDNDLTPAELAIVERFSG